jgi:dienelactone hydrolase
VHNPFSITLLFSILLVSIWSPSTISGKASGCRVEAITLPTPSGPYPVGTVSYHWIDRTREEQWTTELHDFRQLMVQFWYPAKNQNAGREAPYIPELDRLRSSMDQYWPDRPSVRTHATVGAPLSPARKQYPVVIFSHGMNSARFRYTAIIEELASHGYVVAAIDHTYWGPGVAFPNGKTVGLEEGMMARDKLSSGDIDRITQEGITVMAADQNFVAQELAELNEDGRNSTNLFRDRLDLANLGVVGHSMGGMAATRACLEYTAFKACISLDGPNYFLNMMPTSSPKPFLLLLNSDWGLGAPERIKTRYLEAWSDPLVAIIHGTKHNSFSDILLTKTPTNITGLIEPTRALRIISAYCIAFLDQSLRGVPTSLLGKGSEKFPEIEFIDLKALAKRSPATKQ